MKRFEWDEEKNAKLKLERGVGFEDVIEAVNQDRLLDELDHPNKKRYPNQRIFVVNIREYAYYVPIVEDEEKIFFKTIYPNRKATQKYLIKEK